MDENFEKLEKLARRRLKGKRDFWNFAIVALIVCSIVTVIWALTTGGDMDKFWPIWVYLGMGIGLVFSALNAYGPFNNYISEDAVQKEIRKMQGE